VILIHCSGPSTVSIGNADRAMATAAKLTVGEYKFKLTVRDNEGLSDSSTITVIVKPGQFCIIYILHFLDCSNYFMAELNVGFNLLCVTK
jgi:hypothetical protein